MSIYSASENDYHFYFLVKDLDDSKVEGTTSRMELTDSEAEIQAEEEETQVDDENRRGIILPELTFTKETTLAKGLDKKLKKWFRAANSMS